MRDWQTARAELERRILAQKLVDRETGRIRPVPLSRLARDAYAESVEEVRRIAAEGF